METVLSSYFPFLLLSWAKGQAKHNQRKDGRNRPIHQTDSENNKCHADKKYLHYFVLFYHLSNIVQTAVCTTSVLTHAASVCIVSVVIRALTLCIANPPDT